MITKIYRVKGTFVMGDEYHKFTKEYKATCEAEIEEKIYERFGSKHGINRNQKSKRKSTNVSEVNMVLTGIKFLLLKSKKLLLKMF